ncbi:MAG TPA: hypothetical protein VGL61_33885 [Kofleriaceae bacterium]
MTNRFARDLDPARQPLGVGVRAQSEVDVDDRSEGLARISDAGHRSVEHSLVVGGKHEGRLDEDLELARKVIVNQPGHQASLRGDVGDRGPVVAVLRHHSEQGRHDLGPSLVGIRSSAHNWLVNQPRLSYARGLRRASRFPGPTRDASRHAWRTWRTGELANWRTWRRDDRGEPGEHGDVTSAANLAT